MSETEDSDSWWRNDTVAVGSLPAVDAAPFEQLEPRYLTQQRVSWAIWLGLLAIAAVVGALLAGTPALLLALVLVVLVALFAVTWVLEGLAYRYRGVQLRERDVSSRRGLISRKTISVPFTRVQHVTVVRGVFDRLFRLARVVIFTAGAAAADAHIKGLAPDRAERLREGITNRSNAAAASQQASEPGTTEPETTDRGRRST